jgi:predicted HTH transcriptional regulator
VSAFVSAVGGRLYFGVTDGGVAIGLDDPQNPKGQVNEFIKTRLELVVKSVVLKPQQADGKNILCAQFGGCSNTPYYYKGDSKKISSPCREDFFSTIEEGLK